MTANDLMQAYYLEKEIESWKSDEDLLKKMSEFPKMDVKIKELRQKKEDIVNFIMNIEDSQTRLIFKLRCFNLLSWNAVADKIGGMNSEYTVKKRFYRYLKKKGA